MNRDSLVKELRGLSPAVRFEHETDSTNRVALEWARSGAPEWALVVTEYQSAGRGRFDRTWFAPPGECLLFSMVLRPRCDPEEAPLINLAAATAVSEAIHEEGLNPAVKWPNDVLIGGRKAAGILTEAAAETGGRPGGRLCLVVGVGVNVNVVNFPEELAASATSLALEAGRSIDRSRLLARLLQEFRSLYESFPAGVVQAYLRWSDVLGRKVRLDLPGRTIEGRAAGIDHLGNLVLRSGQVISAGDLGYLSGSDA